MKRSEHRILTTHVGSITRPPEMLELASYAKGPPEDPAEYRRRTRLAVENVVRRQAEIGLDIINDGEYGKESWSGNPAEDGRLEPFHHASVIGFDRAGHWLHHDRLDEFLKVLRQFLA